MNILIKNCNLISIEPSKPKIEYNTNILIKNGKIKNISNETITTKTDKVIDGKNKYVIPGMFNCHNHIPMSLFREITDGYKLQD
jgi:5-methylthioadenosine/S-adenosylhomocysteine deaminase